MTLGSTAAMSTDLAASSDSMVSSALDAFTFAASGGQIRGRGTTTSDSIPARLPFFADAGRATTGEIRRAPTS